MYKKVSYQVICDCCGKAFISHDKRRSFCSHKCRDVYYKRSKGQDSRLEPYKRICSICGKEFDTFNYSKKTCSDKCSKKLKYQTDKIRHQRNGRYKHTRSELIQIQKDQAEIKALEKEWYKLLHREKRECKICGSLFYCLEKEANQTCSPECSKKYKLLKDKERRKIHRDNRLNYKNIVDTDITLDKLYKRDNGICYLCGGLCDKSDFVMRDNIKICGPNYPSKDHVIPLSRGGKHQWENVRLAHLKCNIDKSDTTPTYTKEMSREDARRLATERCTNKKKTAQYTLDGRLIKIWDSTAQIRRELGLNDTHIQSVCRGDKSNTGNAYGYHWEYVS